MDEKAMKLRLKICSFIANRKGFITFCLLKLAVVGLGLITNIIIVRKFSVYSYGTYSLVLMLVGFATSFGFSWSSSSLIYYGSKEKAETGNMNRTFWARNMILIFSLAMITLVFIVFKESINAYVEAKISFLILIWIYVKVIEDYMDHYFLAVKKQILSTAMLFTARFVFLILVLLTTFDIQKLIIINIASDFTIVLYLLTIDRKDIGEFQFDSSYFKDILSFSLWQLFGFSGLYIINFGDNLVIKHFMTTRDVGLYNAAYKLFNGIAGLNYVISSYFAANISVCFQKQEVEKLKIFFYKERYIIIIASTFIHIMIILLSKQIVNFLYGERYQGVVTIFIILLFGSIFRYYSVFHMIYYNSTKQHKIQQGINILRAGLNIVLDIVFIKQFGIVGTAIGTSLAILITFIISAYYCEKRIKNICFLTDGFKET